MGSADADWDEEEAEVLAERRAEMSGVAVVFAGAERVGREERRRSGLVVLACRFCAEVLKRDCWCLVQRGAVAMALAGAREELVTGLHVAVVRRLPRAAVRRGTFIVVRCMVSFVVASEAV